MNINFAFFHIGKNKELPNLLVESIKKTNPKSKIIQFSNNFSYYVDGIDQFIYYDFSDDQIMFSRVKSYAEYDFKEPTLFVDTDMIVNKKINANTIFKNYNHLFCKRSFDSLINYEYCEYHGLIDAKGKSFKTIFPFLGCLIGAKNNKIFKKMLKEYNTYSNNLKKWNGDQLVLKKIFNKKNIGVLDEKKYAYPVKEIIKNKKILKEVFIFHFKGKNKFLMKNFNNNIAKYK